MPTIDETMKNAIAAIRDFDDPGEELATQYAKAAISAYFADVPVSEGMCEAGWVRMPDSIADAYKDMSAKLAEEIQ